MAGILRPRRGSHICILVQIAVAQMYAVNPFQVLPEIVGAWPFLVRIATTVDCASKELCAGDLIGVAAFLVSLDIVGGTEPVGAGATLYITVMGLLVLLFMLPTETVSQAKTLRPKSDTYLSSDFVLTFSRQSGQVSPLLPTRTLA